MDRQLIHRIKARIVALRKFAADVNSMATKKISQAEIDKTIRELLISPPEDYAGKHPCGEQGCPTQAVDQAFAELNAKSSSHGWAIAAGVFATCAAIILWPRRR